MHRRTTTPRSRLTAAAVLGLALATTLAACTQGSASRSDDPAGADDDAPVTIRYTNFTAEGGHEADLDAIVAAFEEEHPDIQVEVQVLPYADYFTALQTAVAGGTVADVVDLNYDNFVTYAANGALAPLADVPDGVYAPSLVDAFSYEGQQLGLPQQFSNVVLFYNRSLFDAAGLDYPTDDWTWDDVRAAATALTDREAGIWGDYQPISFHEFYKALAQAGGSFFDEGKSEATFAGPEGVAAATWLIEKSGTVMPTEADGAGTPDFDVNLFAEGRLAMWHTGIWNFTRMGETEGLDWDVVVEPGSSAKASALFTDGVAVTAASQHPEEAELFAEYLTGSDMAVQTRLDTGWSLPPVADESKLDAYLSVTPPDNREAVLASLDAVVLTPVIESQQEMTDIVTEELGNAAAGRKTVEQALTDAQSRVNELLG